MIPSKSHTLLLFFSTLISFVASRGPPKILGRDFKPLQVVNVGQEFRVACPIEAEPSPNIDWFKDGEPITSAWSRFRINSKALKIRSALAKDSGIYECKGANGFGSIIARTRLVVTEESPDSEYHGDSTSDEDEGFGVSPIFTNETLRQSGSLYIPSGNSIRFRCDTKPSSSATVMWFKDGKPVTDRLSRYGSWTLVLHKLTHEDSGTYTCKATNSFGRNEFKIQLEITELIEKRRPSFVAGYPNNATTLAGNDVTLDCVVHGGSTVFPPHIKWLKRVQVHDALIGHKHHLIPVENENEHVLVIKDSEEDGIRVNETHVNGTYVSRLTFKRTDVEKHAGIYVCLATNSVGYTYRDAYLTVLAGAAIMETSSSSTSGIPCPLIVFFLSTALSLLVIASACCLRSYQNEQRKQVQALGSGVRKLATPSISLNSSSMTCSSTQPKKGSSCLKKGTNNNTNKKKEFLMIPNLHHHTSGSMLCSSSQMMGMEEPTTASEIALSRCSYCGEDTSEVSGGGAARTYERCYNTSSYLSSPSHSSFHYNPWT